MLWGLKSCPYSKESEVPHTWELYIRQLKLGCLWGKISRVGKSTSKYIEQFWKLLRNSGHLITQLTIQFHGNERFLRGDFLYHALSWVWDWNGGCYRGGLNGVFNGLFPWSVLTWLFSPAHFYTDGVASLPIFPTGKDVCKSTHHGCDHICLNRGNSYVCKCSKGFILAEDGRRCKSKWSELGFFALIWFGSNFFLEYLQEVNPSPLLLP